MMKNDRMKCHICSNYLHGIERCKFCSFEYDDDLPWTNDVDWDIFEIDDDIEWSFLQIQYRLKSQNIDCLQVINWFDDNVIILIGCNAYMDRIARALGVDKESMVQDLDIGITVINLFKEKVIRTCPHWKEIFND